MGRKIKIKICAVCGKEYSKIYRKTCSVECRDTLRKNTFLDNVAKASLEKRKRYEQKYTRKCKYCGKKFVQSYVQLYAMRKGKSQVAGTCCSSACANRLVAEMARKEKAKEAMKIASESVSKKNIVLRNYQIELNEQTKKAIKHHQCVLVQAPTGAGKTAMAVELIKEFIACGKTIQFLVHRLDILKQTRSVLLSQGVSPTLIYGGDIYEGLNPTVKISTIGSAVYLGAEHPDILFVDECHLFTGPERRKHLMKCKNMGSTIIGLTATPWLLSGIGLGFVFDHMICGPSTKELIAKGFLSEYKLYGPSVQIDLSDATSIGYVDRDYNLKQVTKRITSQVVGDAAEHYKKFAFGKRALCFCTTRDHSKLVVERFKEKGIRAAHIDGTFTFDKRLSILNKFADREIQVLCNADLITTGFDLSLYTNRDVTVEAVIMLRPTCSLSLYLQMVGRALRPKPEPAIILDHAGNAMRDQETVKHGLPCEEREWYLDDRKSRSYGAPTRMCPNCYNIHAMAMECPECGYQYQQEVRGKFPKESSGVLEQINIPMEEIYKMRIDHLIEKKDCGCWIWKGHAGTKSTTHKMPKIKINGEWRSARRLVNELYNGASSSDLTRLKTSCGDPLCISPEHIICNKLKRNIGKNPKTIKIMEN